MNLQLLGWLRFSREEVCLSMNLLLRAVDGLSEGALVPCFV